MSIQLYHKTSYECSKVITQRYSTSFSLGIKTLSPEFRDPIYAIYGMVRLADEIVDTFHGYPKEQLLDAFKQDTMQAIASGISLNPALHSFQQTVNQYQIPLDLINAFFDSMYMDLKDIQYDANLYQTYIYGSAEVVGLMCLKVFCKDNPALYEQLKAPARSLGAAFQKVNFLRDIKDDYNGLGRMYFPNVNFNVISGREKQEIEEDILRDFQLAYEGIMQLPEGAKCGVLLAYKYYLRLFEKIRNTSVDHLKSARIRVNNLHKIMLLISLVFRNYFQTRLSPAKLLQ